MLRIHFYAEISGSYAVVIHKQEGTQLIQIFTSARQWPKMRTILVPRAENKEMNQTSNQYQDELICLV